MGRRVMITGLGQISAIGVDVPSALLSLKKGKSGIGPIRRLQTRLSSEVPAGEIIMSDEELGEMLGLTSIRSFPRTALLAIIAIREAIRDAGFENLPDQRTALVSATTVGGMDRSEQSFPQYMKGGKGRFLRDAYSHDCGYVTETTAGYFGFSGLVTTISTACSSSANAVMLGARLIASGQVDRVVVGGSDGFSRFTLNGFNSLMILDGEPCRPFDQTRAGLNLGEGAGYLMLEAEELAGERALAQVSGYANSNDAFHQTATSPEGKGAYASMSGALEQAGLIPHDIDYVNAHGTGTTNNDLSEGRALDRLFGENLPPVSSTKAFTGHTLGAAGGIEAVFSCLSIKEGLVLPNLNFSTKMEELSFSPATQLRERVSIRHVLSNSFGFGGNSTSLVFSKI